MKTLSVIRLIIISTLIQLTFVTLALSVAFSPDGNRLATSSMDGSVRLWNANTGKEIRAFMAHTDAVLSVAFSPDGNRLATSSMDGSVRLWNANTGKEIRAFMAHTDAVLSVAFSPNGNRLATSSADGSVRLWNANTGKHIHVWDRVKLPAKLPVGFVSARGEKEDFIPFLTAFSVAFSPDGNRLAIGTLYADAQIWNANTGELIYMLNTGTVHSLAFRPDRKRKQLATAFSSEVQLWDTNTGKRIWTFEGNTRIRTLAFSPDGEQLATVNIDGTVQLWDTNTGKRIWTFEGNTRIRSVAFSPDGNQLATGSIDGTVWLLNANTDAIEDINNISIPDKMLASVIRKKLGLKSQEPITQLDLRTLIKLNARDSNITDISGIEHAVSLSELQLDTNHISNISELSRLSGLRVLKLDSNQISDMTPLAQLKNLQSLTFSYQRNDFSDITPLANLKVLFELHLYGNRISDISALSGLTNLWSLLLDVNQISDITPLANLKNLVHLALNDNRISDITPLAKLTNVKYLYLQNNQIRDVSPLAELTNLEELKLYGNPIKDKEPLLALLRKNPDVNIYLKDDGEPLQVKAKAAQRPPLYWISAETGTLHRLLGDKVENLLPSVQNATSLALDTIHGKIYWTEKTSKRTGKIRRANLNGSDVQLIKDLTSVPLYLNLDMARGELYLINSWGKLQRLNVDGSNFQANLITGLQIPKGFAVDSADGKVYWIEQTGKSTGTIRRANLDGTEVSLVKDLTAVPQGIAIDAFNGKLYIANGWGKVQRLNLDGGNFQSNLITGLKSPMDLTVDGAGGKVYWMEEESLSCADLNGENITDVVTGLGMTVSLVLGIAPTNNGGSAAAPTVIASVVGDTLLLPNYPNPFNPETWIPYQLAVPSKVSIAIYAADGKLVRTLDLGYQSVGHYDSRSRAAYWDGRNALGEPVASGVYFYTLTAAEFTATRKMLILK